MAKKRKPVKRKTAVKKRRKSATTSTKSVAPMPNPDATPSKRGDDLLSTAEVAKLLGINEQSLRRKRSKISLALPSTKDTQNHTRYKRSDVDAYLGSDGAGESTRFNEEAPSHLPPPEPIDNGTLTKHNLDICEAMARTGMDLEKILERLRTTRYALDTDVLERLTLDISMWRADTLYAVNRAVIASALHPKGQVAPQQLAAKMLQNPDDPEGWSAMTENAAERITALIEKHKKRTRERKEIAT